MYLTKRPYHWYIFEKEALHNCELLLNVYEN